MGKAKIMWYVFTDNPQWGRYYIGKSESYRDAISLGRNANKGKFVIERRHEWR